VAFIVLIFALFSSGCLSIDTTPLRDQDFYLKTRESLEGVQAHVGPDPPSHPLMIGTARVDITPPVGTPLAGYGSRKGRGSTGIHDRLFTRAMALGDGNHTVILLANDLLAITDDMRTAVYQKISREIALNPDSLMISASHTHSGPGALAKRFWESFATGPFEPAVFEEVTRKMARAAVEAYQEMKPARLGGGNIPVPDLISNRMMVGGPKDPALSFLVFKTLDQAVTAYLVNYSAHPTVLKDNNDFVSGDFPGALERRLEETPGVIALYTAGAVADMTASPPEGRDDFEKADKMGRILANKILEALPSVVLRDHARIGSVLATVQLPSTQVKLGMHRLASPLGNLFFDRQTVIQAIRVGDSLLLGVPCDLSSEIGLEIKQQARSHELNAIIVGFANDYMGYVIPEKYYYTDTYEARMSFNGPYMDRYLKEVSFELMKKLIVLGRAGDGD
jgi:hypothetical protein